MLDLKRAGRRDGLETLCGWMRQAGGALINDAEVLVPLHFTRLAVLVDDVLTTGATMSACTRALKQEGARHVDVLVLARVVRETDVTI